MNEKIHEAMAIQNGKIISLGKNNQILNKYQSNHKIDLKGNVVYPGFIDAHCHLLSYGLQNQQVDLTSCQSFDEVISKLKKFISENDTKWIIGNGWDQNNWPTKKWPTNEQLNKTFPNHNVVLNRIDGHALMANKKAILSSNINPDTNIYGGYIEIIDHELTGIFVDNAMDLILKHVPPVSEEANKKALITAQNTVFHLVLLQWILLD